MSFKLSKQSVLTGKQNEMTLNVSGNRLLEWLRTPKAQQQPIEEAFPTLSKVECAFVMTGITAEEALAHSREAA